MTFEKGNRVRQKNGGPVMTIKYCSHKPGRFICEWLNNVTCNWHLDCFDEEELEIYKGENQAAI